MQISLEVSVPEITSVVSVVRILVGDHEVDLW